MYYYMANKIERETELRNGAYPKYTNHKDYSSHHGIRFESESLGILWIHNSLIMGNDNELFPHGWKGVSGDEF